MTLTDLALVAVAISIWAAIAVVLTRGFTGFDQDPDDSDRP